MVSLSQLGQPPWPADAYAVAITIVVSYACAPVHTYRHDRTISGPEPGYEGGPRDIPVNSLVDVPVISPFWQKRIFLPPQPEHKPTRRLLLPLSDQGRDKALVVAIP